jgi:hypothetical protein
MDGRKKDDVVGNSFVGEWNFIELMLDTTEKRDISPKGKSYNFFAYAWT